VFPSNRQSRSSPFAPRVALAVVVGSVLATLFYLLILWTPLTHPLIVRYANCHWVSNVSVYMFTISIILICQKVIDSRVQRANGQIGINNLLNMTSSAADVAAIENVHWLATLWRSQPSSVSQSWFGSRISEALERQASRNHCHLLEEDLKELAERDETLQHESYGLIRMMVWAMPMLGFLGTVIGISETLGQMDTKLLASGSQEAMNKLTGGLYVAFDTTAVGLVLTMATMFLMFATGRIEQSLLGMIDTNAMKTLQNLLIEKAPEQEDPYRIEAAVQKIGEQFSSALNQVLTTMVEHQAQVWAKTIDSIENRWTAHFESTERIARTHLSEALDSSLTHLGQRLDQSQKQHLMLVEDRFHQWQTTLSSESRTIHGYQQKSQETVQLLHELIERCDQFRALENSLLQNLTHLTQVDRFHEVAICLTEAVAVLGTQIERMGILGKSTIRRSSHPAPETNRPGLQIAPNTQSTNEAPIQSAAAVNHVTKIRKAA
jgi:biopolymer transport protein ExbB/TolQ